MTDPKQVLSDLYDLYATDHRAWVQGAYRINPDEVNSQDYLVVYGQPVPEVECYCLMGGIGKVLDVGPATSKAGEVAIELVKSIPVEAIDAYVATIDFDPDWDDEEDRVTRQSILTDAGFAHDFIVDWNDTDGRTINEILDVLKRARDNA